MAKKSYKVKSGDGWYKIAKNTGLDVNQLLKLNNANINTMIHPGQELILEEDKQIPSVEYNNTYVMASDNTRTRTPFAEEFQRNSPTISNRDWAQQAEAYRQANPVNVQAAPQQKPEESPKEKPSLAKRVLSAVGSGYVTNPAEQERTDKNPIVKNTTRFVSNLTRSPGQAITDAALYLADVAGAPTNATNYLRDLNVSLPYRAKNAIHAGIESLYNGQSFGENYNNRLANPSYVVDATTIRPLENTNNNFNDQELSVMREMAGNDFQINNADIKRVSGKYGGKGSIASYFAPDKVVQTAIGQSGGNADDKQITDLFDVNTIGETARHDNQMYVNMAKENPGFNYETMRATMPFLNMIDIMPDRYKISTKVKYEK